MNPIHTATTMSAVEGALSSNLLALSYPRTGKRGVPQQFARRLYEMLQSESKLAITSPNQTVFISWSESGLAFRIHDVDGFTSSVLPKYFRTKKFSSFQRNLNLVSTYRLTHSTAYQCSGKYDIPTLLQMNSLISRTLFLFVDYCSTDLPKCGGVQIQISTPINPSLGAILNCSCIYGRAHQLPVERCRLLPSLVMIVVILQAAAARESEMRIARLHYLLSYHQEP